MKKFITILSIILFLLSIICVGVWFAPYILNIKLIKQKIITKVERKLNANISVQYIKWVWLPFSHIELLNTQYKQEKIYITIPKITIYPNFNKIFSGHIEISKIVFDQPYIKILKFKISSKSNSKLSFPTKKVVINNGEVALFTNINHIKRIYKFKNINLSANLGNKLSLNIKCIPPAAKYLALKFNINLKTKNYYGQLNVNQLKAHQIFLSYINKQPIMPIKAILNINSSFSGNSNRTFQATINGYFPCLVLKKKDKYLNISCGQAQINIYKKDNILKLTIDKLYLTNPKLNLSGICTIRSTQNCSKVYAINLLGQNIDLTTIRQELLALWNKNKIVKVVCNIVRAGEAKIAAFSFYGHLKDLKNINKLHIYAKIKNAKIFIPYGKLNITNIKGKIKIEDGALIAQNISGQIDDNYAKNGLLILGLHGKLNDLFHLQIKLNSNLAQLKDILNRVIPNKHFRHELTLFSNIKGRAIGSLYLGESLKHIKYRVVIDKAQANLTYRRLFLPIKINNLSLFINNYIISWNKTNIIFDNQHILDSNGTIVLSHIPWIIVRNISANIKARNFLDYLKHYPNILANLHKVITDLQGNMILKKCHINGPLFSPTKWLYNIQIISHNCVFNSPKLPGNLFLKECNIQIKNHKLNIIKVVGTDNNTPISINGYLAWKGINKNLQLNGSLNITGTLNQVIANWIKDKHWIPNDFFPSVPLYIKNLHIDWNVNNVKLSTKLIKKSNNKKDIYVYLKLEISKKYIIVNNLKIKNYNLNQQLIMSLKLNRINNSIDLLWDGILSKNSIDNILEQNEILKGEINGSFSFLYDPSHNINKLKFLGMLTAENLIWKWGLNKPIYFRHLTISGNTNYISINTASIKFPDKNRLELAGQLFILPKKIKLHLICSSNYLTSNTFNSILKKTYSKNKKSKTSRNKTKHINLSGDISFYINRYKYYSNKNKYIIFKELTGKIFISNSKINKLHIEHTWLCNLAISGCIYPSYYSCNKKKCTYIKTTNNHPCYLWIRTIKNRNNNFKDILSCLKIKQDMISGNLNINIKLLGNPKCWHRGTIHIWSSQGRIYKFTALAKILSIINFTDLVTEGIPKLNKKGFGYSKLDIKGQVINNKLKIQQAYIKGEGLNIFATGWINIKTWNVDLTVLVSPFKTIDIVLKYIPIVGEIIGGKNRTFITIPIGIKGPINNPNVKPLPISAIGKGLLGIVKRTLGLPMIVIKSIKDI